MQFPHLSRLQKNGPPTRGRIDGFSILAELDSESGAAFSFFVPGAATRPSHSADRFSASTDQLVATLICSSPPNDMIAVACVEIKS
jgi:hypothetical protein